MSIAIISRAAWGANPLITPASPIALPTPELWLHHSAGEQFGAAGMRMLQSFTLHRQDAHYVDLEYTFVVDHQSCQIFESRGPGRNTAATGGHNDVSHAICVMGNFQNDDPSDHLLDTLAELVVYGYRQGWWKYPRFTGGHRDASGNSTACPGDHLEAKLGEINARAAHLLEPHPPQPTPPEGTVQFAAKTNQDGRMELFALNGDGHLTHCWRNKTGGDWVPWQPFPGGPFDAFDLAKNDDGRLELFAHPTGGITQHCFQTAPNNGWSAWSALQ